MTVVAVYWYTVSKVYTNKVRKSDVPFLVLTEVDQARSTYSIMRTSSMQNWEPLKKNEPAHLHLVQLGNGEVIIVILCQHKLKCNHLCNVAFIFTLDGYRVLEFTETVYYRYYIPVPVVQACVWNNFDEVLSP